MFAHKIEMALRELLSTKHLYQCVKIDLSSTKELTGKDTRPMSTTSGIATVHGTEVSGEKLYEQTMRKLAAMEWEPATEINFQKLLATFS